MRLNRIPHVFLTLSLVFFLATLAFSQAGDPPPPPGTPHGVGEMGMFPFGGGGKWWKRPAFVEKLKLTPDQVNAIESIFDANKKQLTDTKIKLENAMKELRTLIHAETIQRDAVLKLVTEIGNLRTEISKAMMIMQLDIREKLTPQQREELKKMRDGFRERMENRPLGPRGRGFPDRRGRR